MKGGDSREGKRGGFSLAFCGGNMGGFGGGFLCCYIPILTGGLSGAKLTRIVIG
jgi:hypothetical protein